MTRLKDPALMRELHEVWSEETGCALCGYMPMPDAGPGWALEMHHIVPRSQGGPDATWNVMALCGALAPNRCHERVTQHEVKIERNEAGFLIWRDMRAGGTLAQPCRWIAKYSQLVPNGNPVGASADTSETVDPLPTQAESDTESVPITPVDPPQEGASLAVEPAGDAPPLPDDPPELRASQIRDRVTASKRLMMEAAILLHNASERGDHLALGVSWSSYYAALGLERATVSRMITAATTLGEEWMQLAPSTREQVGLEAAYQGALLVTKGGWSASDAMDAAVSTPTAHLIALRTGDEPSSRCRCTCPVCGREDVWHQRA